MMKNLKWKFNLIFLLCLPFLPQLANAGEIEETIITERSYLVDSDTKLEIFSKYGTVHINTWNSDSLVIMATQKFTASDKKQLKRLKEMQSLVVTKTHYIILVKSEYEDPAKDLLNLLPIDIMGSGKTDINIEIWMPEYVNLTLEHRYGDVFLGNLMGDAFIDVSHGQFKAGSIYGKLKLDANYCNTTLRFVENGNISCRFDDLAIDSANKITLESRSADVWLGHGNLVQINGRNDDIWIESCDELHLDGYFSKANFDLIYGNVYTKTSYGNLNMAFPKGYDSSINIKSNYTDIELSFNDGYGNYPVNILHQKSKIMYTSSGTQLKEEKVSGKDVIYKTSGSLGSGKPLDGLLDVEMFSGELKLIVK